VYYGTQTGPIIPQIAINIQGTNRPTIGCVTNCTVFQSDRSTGNGIGGFYGSGSGVLPFTYVRLGLENILFRTFTNSGITWVNGTYIAAFDVKHLWFDDGDYSNWAIPNTTFPLPTNTAQNAIIFPGLGNGVTNLVNDISEYHYYNGFTFGEHQSIVSAFALNSQNCFVLNNAGIAMSAAMIWAQSCYNTVSVTGQTNVTSLQISSEAATNAIYDPGNFLSGNVVMQLTAGGGAIVGGRNASITFTNANGIDHTTISSNSTTTVPALGLYNEGQGVSHLGLFTFGTGNNVQSVLSAIGPTSPVGYAQLKPGMTVLESDGSTQAATQNGALYLSTNPLGSPIAPIVVAPGRVQVGVWDSNGYNGSIGNTTPAVGKFSALSLTGNLVNTAYAQQWTGTSCTTGAGTLTACGTSITFPVAEPDTNYQIQCSMLNDSVFHIQGGWSSPTTTGATWNMANATASGGGGTLKCLILHHP